VVYGDTDSVFVNSNVTNFEDALRISAAFKKAVNEQYRLLEIDLDGWRLPTFITTSKEEVHPCQDRRWSRGQDKY